MSDDATARWAFLLLQPGQAQKEMVHNEAITTLDLLVHTVAEAILDTPPSAPEAGKCWIVGEDPTGAWADKSACLAGWTSGGWRFVDPVAGMTAWLLDNALSARFHEGDWVVGEQTAHRLSIGGEQVVGARQAAIADPAGGSVVDVEARTVLGNVLTALRTHGLIQN